MIKANKIAIQAVKLGCLTYQFVVALGTDFISPSRQSFAYPLPRSFISVKIGIFGCLRMRCFAFQRFDSHMKRKLTFKADCSGVNFGRCFNRLALCLPESGVAGLPSCPGYSNRWGSRQGPHPMGRDDPKSPLILNSRFPSRPKTWTTQPCIRDSCLQ
jgi:hypothetical protein